VCCGPVAEVSCAVGGSVVKGAVSPETLCELAARGTAIVARGGNKNSHVVGGGDGGYGAVLFKRDEVARQIAEYSKIKGQQTSLTLTAKQRSPRESVGHTTPAPLFTVPPISDAALAAHAEKRSLRDTPFRANQCKPKPWSESRLYLT